MQYSYFEIPKVYRQRFCIDIRLNRICSKDSTTLGRI